MTTQTQSKFDKHIDNAITELESAKQELEDNDGYTNRLRDDLDDVTESLFNEIKQGDEK